MDMKKMMKWTMMFASALVIVSMTACGGDDDEPTKNPDPDPQPPVGAVKGTVAQALAAAEDALFCVENVTVVATDGHTILVKDDSGYIFVESTAAVVEGDRVTVTGEIDTEYGMKCFDDGSVVVKGEKNNLFTHPSPTIYDMEKISNWLVTPAVDMGRFEGLIVKNEDGSCTISLPGGLLAMPKILHPDATMFKDFESGTNAIVSAYLYGYEGESVLLLPVKVEKPAAAEFSWSVGEETVMIAPEGGFNVGVITVVGSDDRPEVTIDNEGFSYELDGPGSNDRNPAERIWLVRVTAETNPYEYARTATITVKLAGETKTIAVSQDGYVRGEKVTINFEAYYGRKAQEPYVTGEAVKLFREPIESDEVPPLLDILFTVDNISGKTAYTTNQYGTSYYLFFANGDKITLSSDTYVFRQIEYFGLKTESAEVNCGTVKDAVDIGYDYGGGTYIGDPMVWTGESSSVTVTAGKDYYASFTAIRITYVENK